MYRKLEELADRYRELSETIAQPEVIQDYPRWQACLRERAALEPLVNAYDMLLQVEKQITETRELISDPANRAVCGDFRDHNPLNGLGIG